MKETNKNSAGSVFFCQVCLGKSVFCFCFRARVRVGVCAKPFVLYVTAARERGLASCVVSMEQRKVWRVFSLGELVGGAASRGGFIANRERARPEPRCARLAARALHIQANPVGFETGLDVFFSILKKQPCFCHHCTVLARSPDTTLDKDRFPRGGQKKIKKMFSLRRSEYAQPVSKAQSIIHKKFSSRTLSSSFVVRLRRSFSFSFLMTLKKSVPHVFVLAPKNTSTPLPPPNFSRRFFFHVVSQAQPRCASSVSTPALPALRRSILAWSSSIWFTFTVDTTPPSAPPLAPTPAALAAMRSCHQGRPLIHGITSPT